MSGQSLHAPPSGSDPALGPAAVESLDTLFLSPSLAPTTTAVLADCTTVEEAFARLLALSAIGDAVRILSMTVPIRQGVWWSALCAWESTGGAPSPAEDSALASIVRWVVAPSETARRAVHETTRSIERHTPIAASARAATLAGSAAGPGQPLVPRHLVAAAKQVSTSIFHSIDLVDRQRRKVTLRQFLDVGLEIRAGQLDWQMTSDNVESASSAH